MDLDNKINWIIIFQGRLMIRFLAINQVRTRVKTCSSAESKIRLNRIYE